MKRSACVLLAAILGCAVFAQEPENAAISYQRNFVRSSLDAKIELLKEASRVPSGSMNALYEQALQFVLDNYVLLKNDASLRDLGTVAVGAVDNGKDSSAVPQLLQLFQAYRETSIRVPLIRALGNVGAGNGEVVEFLNSYLSNQVKVFKTGVAPDLDVILQCVDAVGKVGDGSSYASLFSAVFAGFGEPIAAKAREALAAIKGDYKKFLVDAIRKNPMSEKAVALDIGLTNAKFSPSETAEIAEAGLDIGLNQPAANGDEAQALSKMRYSSIKKLITIPWPKASPLAVRHFKAVWIDYDRNEATKSQLLDAIACLGSMGTPEAAQQLSVYLPLIYDKFEQGKQVDEEIIVAVITNLGKLGGMSAFDLLVYISNMSSSDSVKQAARDALGALK